MNKGSKLNIDREKFTEQVLKGFTIKQLEEYWSASKTTVTDCKRQWGLVGLSPNCRKLDRPDGTKTCRTCMLELPMTEFYSNGTSPNGKKKWKAHCKSCSNNTKRRDLKTKFRDILEKQGRPYKCELCGYSKNTAALCFHHKTDEKNFSLGEPSAFNKPQQDLEYEISICAVLCHNCHMELHYPHLTTFGDD